MEGHVPLSVQFWRVVGAAVMHLPITGIVGGAATPSTLLTGLDEWWEFAETTGNRIGSHAGTPMVPNSSAVTRVAGKVNWAVNLTSTHCTVTEAAAPFIELSGHTAVTWAYWLYVTGWVGNAGVFGRWDAGNSYLSWTAVSGGANKLEWGGHSTRLQRTGLPTNTWFQVIQTYDPAADLLAAYINNDAGVTASWAGPFAASTAVLAVGRYTVSGGTLLPCYLSEFAKWNRVLTSGERSELYNGGAGIAYSSL